MVYKGIIREEALSDTLEDYNYYEQQKIGLGEEFLMALIKRYDDLAEHPSHYSFIDGQSKMIFRDAKLERFPYVVIFEIAEREVIVYAVHHTLKHQVGTLRKT